MHYKNTFFKRPLALLLSFVLILTLMPIQVFAEENDGWDGGEPEAAQTVITAFATLTDSVANRSVEVGTSLTVESLNLPDTLYATISDGETETEAAINGVTWQSEPGYTAITIGEIQIVPVGTYVFIAVLPQGYTAAEGVALPLITVEVQPPAIVQYAAAWDGSTATDFAENTSEDDITRDGTQAKPYLIESAENLAYLRDKVNDGTSTYSGVYFELTTDIDLANKKWVPIGGYNGTAADTTKQFAGIFDGGDYCISGLNVGYIDGSSTTESNKYQYAGLFGYINGASISNLGVSGYAYAGGLVGYLNAGTITECYSNATVTVLVASTYAYTGGLAGYQNGGEIKDCYATGNIFAEVTGAGSSGGYNKNNYVGGLVGYQTGGKINNCYTTGDTSAKALGTYTNVYAGGLVGYQGSSEIKACYTTGNTGAEAGTSGSSMSAYAGGLVGNCYATSTATARIIACYTAGDVTAVGYYTRAGGVAGSYPANSYSTITGCFWNKASTQTVNDNSQSPQRGTTSLDGDNMLALTKEDTQTDNVLAHLNALSAAAGVTWQKGENGGWPVAVMGLEAPYSTWKNGIFDSTSGNGDSAENAYIIKNWQQLYAFSGSVNSGSDYASKYILLADDIDLTDIYFIPIGLTSNYQFNGNFNGNNKTIKGLTIDRANFYCGLFGYIGANGVVSGVNIAGGKVICSSTNSYPCTGLLAGYSKGKILYCNVQGEVTGAPTAEYNGAVGGLVGYFDSAQVIGCSARGTADGTSTKKTNVGGLVGYAVNGGVVKSSYASVAITAAAGADAGGLIGNRSAYTYIDGGYWDKTCNQDVGGNRADDAKLGAAVANGGETGITAKTEAQIKSGAFTDELNTVLNVTDHSWIIDSANAGFPYIGSRSVLGGSVTISGNMIDDKYEVGQTLTADITALTPSVGTGAIYYQWMRDGLYITDANSRTYTITSDDAGHAINVRVTAKYCGGSVTSVSTVQVQSGKSAGPTVDNAPTLVSKTHNSITVNAVTISSNPENTTVEYAIATSDAVMPTSWQSGTTFNNLNASTTYYVYARAKESTNYYAGTAKVSAAITTDSNTATISFNANGGNGAMSNATAFKGTFNMPLCSFNRNNYSFVGWKIGNSGTTYPAGATITLNGDITLYAQWTSTIKKASQTITASNQTKTYGDGDFSLGAKLTVGNGTLSYKSSDEKVCTVSSNGIVTIKGVGQAKITITASETSNYNKGVKTVTITVKENTSTGRVVGYYNIKTDKIKGNWDGTHYILDGKVVKDSFFCDGTYTYYLQADGTPMKNKLSYDPEGTGLIYFNKDGHMQFDTFVYCEDVGYTCYFATDGRAYFDEITYCNGKAYYLDSTGRMQQNEWFQFANGVDYGYANADGSLMNSGFSYDPWGRVVFFHWNGMVARGLITDGVWYYHMDETDGHLLGQFAAN